MVGILSLMMELFGKNVTDLESISVGQQTTSSDIKEHRTFHITVQGTNHIRSGKECQDASKSDQTGTSCICAVCDGHGGNDYARSAVGARIACETAIENIKVFLNDVNKEELRRYPDKILSNLEASIISDWNEKVRIHYETNDLTVKEIGILSERAKRKYIGEDKIESLYGTTLIAAAVMDEYWFGIQIGDGKCIVVDGNGNFSQPIPWDEKCFLNETTSICDVKALQNFRHVYSEKLPVAVLMGSDGIDDCFQNDRQLYDFYKTILYFFTANTFDCAVSELEDYLPRLSAKGSGDDISLSAILCMDKLAELSSIKEFGRKVKKTDG